MSNSPETVRSRLLGIITEFAPVFQEDDFEKPFTKIGFDSLAQVNIRVAIEKAFGRRTTHKQWFSFKSFSDVCRFLELEEQ